MMKDFMEMLRERPLYQKWMAGIGLVILLIFVIREMFYWSMFHEVMAQINQENQAIQKSQTEIRAEAEQMKQQMADKVKDFKVGADKTTSKMVEKVNDITSSALEAESKMSELGSTSLFDEIHMQMIEESILRSRQKETFIPRITKFRFRKFVQF